MAKASPHSAYLITDEVRSSSLLYLSHDYDADEAKQGRQGRFVMDEGVGLSTAEQEYDLAANVDEIRQRVDAWRQLPNPRDWGVTPETEKLA